MFTGTRRQCKTQWLPRTYKRLALSRGQLSGILRRDGRRVPSSVAGPANGRTKPYLSPGKRTTSLPFVLTHPAGALRLVTVLHTTNGLPPKSEPKLLAPASVSRRS